MSDNKKRMRLKKLRLITWFFIRKLEYKHKEINKKIWLQKKSTKRVSTKIY